MIKILAICIAVLVLAAVSYPFLHDAYNRYLISQRLDAVMNANERAEFRQWNGDAISFARRLFEQCELTQGNNAPPCQRYRAAYQDFE
ncbi:MAG TPA: hypothetical protein VHW90_14420 [Stellaceae bacterium]|jgi:hypothetical protein|nr:hypothetical protein [Stellaceae bacterium]